MAKLTLTLYEAIAKTVDQAATQTSNSTDGQKTALDFNTFATISTDGVTHEVGLPIDENETIKRFQLNLIDIRFKKKMYQPTEVLAWIQITMAEGNNEFSSVSKDNLIKTFQNKKVSLTETTSTDKAIMIGEDYYVHEVEVHYKPSSMFVTLKIYSLDKLLTLKQASRTFVAKKLKDDILANEMKKYKLPYDPATNPEDRKSVSYLADNMKVLSYKDGDNTTEHIFPYLVQYNESFYDLLARTTNRWGEFMFYEDGKLNIGYDEKGATLEVKKNFDDIYYFDLNNENLVVATDGKYDYAAAYDKNVIGKPLKKSPNEVKGTMYCPNGKLDKVVMKKFAAFFKNDKSLPTFISNQVFSDSLDIALKTIDVAHRNSEFNDTFFPSSNKPGDDEQYGQYDFSKKKDGTKMADAFNQFTELKGDYNASKYKEILSKEEAAAKNAVNIDFGTTYPDVKLGQFVKVQGQTYIVVEITAGLKQSIQSSLVDGKYVEDYIIDEALVFNVVATAQDSKNKKNKIYYPTIIPAGHVKLSAPQLATITDTDDPSGKNRVRVQFAWEKDEEITDETKKNSSPWLTFTSNSQGSSVTGKHYENDDVMVGFADGNIERPYILGCLSQDAGDGDVCYTSPGGHQLSLYDDEGGIQKFLTQMFLPGWGTLTGFIPQMSSLNAFKGKDNNLALGGGFEISDKYGVYKITGSTDSREVSIASAWGNVNINAFTGISISAPNGDVKISGKNVTIEAGNNLKLLSGKNVDYKLFHTGKQDTWGGSFAQAAVDIQVAVTKKLAEMATNIVDLSIIRSFLEIPFRPIEGSLTVKSNRFLKLEAGKNKAKYPETAFNIKKKQQMLDAEKKSDILAGVGSGTFLDRFYNLSLDNGMVTLFSTIKPATEALATQFKNKMKACIYSSRKLYWAYFDTLAFSDDNQVGCKKFEELKEEFWKEGDYVEWKEDKLGFKDNFKVVAEADKKDYQKLKSAIDKALVRKRLGLGKNDRLKKGPASGEREVIMEKRLRIKANIIQSANELRKAICELLKLKEFTRKDMNKFFGVYIQTMPDDFKGSLATAMSKKACASSPIFNLTDEVKDLEYNDFDDMIPFDNLKKHYRRLVTYNLLSDLGFDAKSRKKVNGADVPEPDVNDLTIDGDQSLLNENYWTKYVQSLHGVPALSKDSKTYGYL